MTAPQEMAEGGNVVIDSFPPELSFPPFPEIPSAHVIPFADSTVNGVWIPPTTGAQTAVAAAHDHQGLPLVAMERPYTGINHTFEQREAHKRAVKRAAIDRKRNNPNPDPIAQLNNVMHNSNSSNPQNPPNPKPKARLAAEDCWKIGNPAEQWHEPGATCAATFDVGTPPFARLITANSHFIASRDAELSLRYNKRLFDFIRDLLGIRTVFKGRHWPGSGPAAAQYPLGQRRADARLAPALLPSQVANEKGGYPRLDEACVLLREPENAIRRLLTLARKESQAFWNFDPALKFAIMTSAFMSFLVHHNVFPEPSLHSAFQRAARIAQSSATKLLNARDLENIIISPSKWNRACWAVWGAENSGAEVGGPEKELAIWGDLTVDDAEADHQDAPEEDNGGWIVEKRAQDSRPEPPTVEDGLSVVTNLVAPIPTADISLIKSIPFAHRIIVAVLPPLQASPGVPAYTSKCYRLITIPSPQKLDTQWTAPAIPYDDEDEAEPADQQPDHEQPDSVDEPEELQIWVEGDSFIEQDGGHRLVGMGLQGRWGLMGVKDGDVLKYDQWWTFKTRDFVLPAI